MGIGESLKGIYYSGEEKWYAFWDKVDAHIPVYKVIDPIDSVIPTFALFLIIIFLILLFAGYALLGGIAPATATLKLSVVDSDGMGVSGATVTVEGVDGEFYSNDFGLIEDLIVPFNSTLEVNAEKGESKTTIPITIDEFEKIAEVVLPVERISFEQKTIRFQSEDGALIQSELRLHYTCSSGVAAPEDVTIYTGSANLAQPANCGTLEVEVTSSKYERARFSVSGPSGVFTLKLLAPVEKGRATVNLKYESRLITEQVTVQAFRADNAFLPVNSATSVNGQVQFELPLGDYKFKSLMQSGYKQKESSVVSITKANSNPVIDLDLQKEIIGVIVVQAKENGAALSGVHMSLTKKLLTRQEPVIDRDTNEGGYVQFEIAEDANYTVTATKDNYCEVSVAVSIGDSRVISMKQNDSTCGYKLIARVIDQDNKPVAHAKAAIFIETAEDIYKMPRAEQVTGYNGDANWNPVRKTNSDEKFKVFAYKASYSGWSEARVFDSLSSSTPFVVKLEIPMGTVKVIAKDRDANPLQFAEVQLFDEYDGTAVSGRKLIENADGSIEFNLKADKRVYAVVKKEGYESYTTLPTMMVAGGTITFDVELFKPPVQEIFVRSLGFFKNGTPVLKVEPSQEYDALFELTAPSTKTYSELGFFVRMGADNMTKTELDKIFIKDVMASGVKSIVTGATYNKPMGYYNTDSKYTNLEESKWAEIKWPMNGYVPGKIIVGVKVKIRPTAQAEERLELGYRAWGKTTSGVYERDLIDDELGTSQSSTTKQELYASTKPDYITVGMETLCDTPESGKSFCITATYTDPDGFTKSFNDSFDTKNNTPYNVSIKIMNNSTVGFDDAKIMVENPEENLYMGTMTAVTPRFSPSEINVNGYATDWIDMPRYVKNSSIEIQSMQLTPQKTGTGTLLVKIREGASMIYEKAFTVNIASDKKLTVRFMKGGVFGDEMPKLVSGKTELLTVKALNTVSGLEVQDAVVKLFDRFGTKLFEATTNKLGVATIQIPASLPGERLVLSIEKSEYETVRKDIVIAEDVVSVDPTSLNFTVNPQSKLTDMKTVKITNETAIDLYIKSITLTGKLKGVLDEASISAWFENFKGKKIKSQDYEEVVFKVASAAVVPTAEDLEGTFNITLISQGKEWVKEIPAKIRVGLGKDVDNQSCLEVTKTMWDTTTRGAQVEASFELRNNCTVNGAPVILKNIGATVSQSTTVTGTFNAQSKNIQVELGSAFARIFKTSMDKGEKVPVTIKFTPMPGSAGIATGSIIFEALNNTDSKAQKLTAEMKYNIIYENLQDCVVLGADELTIEEEGSGTFTVNNNCKSKVDVILRPQDLQGSINNTDFKLNAGENKEVTVKSYKGQIAGAYNVVLEARSTGASLEPVANIKVIIEPKSSCFKLTRYVYDIFDYEDSVNPFDGIDRGYLINNCVTKNVTAKVTGTIPYDSSAILKTMLWGGLVGGVTAYFKTGKFWPDSWFNKKDPKVSSNIQTGYTDVAHAQRSELTRVSTEMQTAKETNYGQIDAKLKALKKQADDTNAKVVNRYNLNRAECEKISANPADASRIACLTKATSIKADAQAIITKQYAAAETDINALREKLKKAEAEFSTQLKASGEKMDSYTEQQRSNASFQVGQGTINNEKANREMDATLRANISNLRNEMNAKIDAWNGYRSDFMNTLYKKYEKLDLSDVEKQKNNKITADAAKPEKYSLTTAALDAVTVDKVEEKEFSTAPAITAIDTTKSGPSQIASNGLASTNATTVTATDVITSSDGYTLIKDDGTNPSAAPADYQPMNSLTSNIGRYYRNPESLIVRPTGNDSYTVTRNDGQLIGTWSYNNSVWTETIDSSTNYYDSSFNHLKKNAKVDGFFLLATSGTGASTGSTSSSGSNSNQSSGMNAILNGVIGYGAGSVMPNGLGGALAGALTTGFMQWMQAQDTTVNYKDTFEMNWIEFVSATLDSPSGVKMDVGEAMYDYETYYGTTVTGSTVSETTNATYSGNIKYNAEALNATVGTVEERELTFTNSGKLIQEKKWTPFVGLMTVKGQEKIYDTTYKYDEIKEKAIERGDYEEEDGFFDNFFSGPNNVGEIAQIADSDIDVNSVRSYEKKFHLLFEAWQYVDCGPRTYACPIKQNVSCDVDGKKGVTGPEGVPRILLDWTWGGVAKNECDSDVKSTGDRSASYNYCDTTQLTISTLKKLSELRDFFSSPTYYSNLQCPKAIDIAGTKTQKLSETAIDIGITSIQMIPNENGATIETIVETTNNVPMQAKVAFTLTRADGSAVNANCPEETKTITSSGKFTCTVTQTGTGSIGVGTFNVVAVMTPTIVAGVEDNVASNNIITASLIMGSTGAAQCLGYSTQKEVLEKVFAASSAGGTNVLESKKYLLEDVSFKANLIRDGFSKDFKEDFDAWAMQILASAPEYNNLRELFLSDKFSVKWPTKGSSPWDAGKYDAKLVVTFKDNWKWDYNNIESVVLDLSPQGAPDPDFTIYNVPFDGMIGINSDDGRQGYGADYVQKTEDIFQIAETAGNVVAQPKAGSNAATRVNMSVIKGTNAFTLLNSSPTRGNVLSIYRIGDDVDFTITPSLAVPVILDIERKAESDAAAFYTAEVNGQPQETGTSFISWTGIGQGCVAFDGTSMTQYYNTPDYKANSCFIGYDGYGLCWPMAKVSGKSSFYGQFFAPQDTVTVLKVTGSKGTAGFYTTFGEGTTIQVGTTGSEIRTLEKVLALVKEKKVCVIGGDYYWNNSEFTGDTEFKSQMNARENTCIDKRP